MDRKPNGTFLPGGGLVTKPCAHCHRDFTAYRSHQQEFCSRECYGRAAADLYAVGRPACAICGASCKKARNKYCSLACKVEAQTGRLSTTVVESGPLHPLTEEDIEAAARSFLSVHLRRPEERDGDATEYFGQVETWGAVSQALRCGWRGLPGKSSLAKLCVARGIGVLTREGVVAAVRAYFEQHGVRPNPRTPIREGRKPIDASEYFGFEITWQAVDLQLQRGLGSKTSLSSLCDELGLARERRAYAGGAPRKPIDRSEDVVYLFELCDRHGKVDRYKIGISCDVNRRLAEASGGSSGICLRSFPGTRRDEQRLHRTLQPYRLPLPSGRPSEFYQPVKQVVDAFLAAMASPSILEDPDVCAHPGCPNHVYSAGLCMGHDAQERNGKELRELYRRDRPSVVEGS